ncbi:MAG TPA: TolC family protein [Sedimentisphaerales bacterium]|nr:TolC family protein [Sedimentisphaerales bacterium]
MHRVVAGLLIMTVATFGLGGCASKGDIYRDVQGSRLRAYQDWQRQRQTNERDETFVKGYLSLQDAFKLTLQHSKTLRAAIEEREAARGMKLASYSAILPGVTAGADYTRLDRVSSFRVGDIRVEAGDLDNYSVNLTVVQPIFQGGAIPARLQLGKLAKLLGEESVRLAMQEVTFELARSYYDVLLNQHMHAISVDAVESSRANLESVRQKREAGIASDFDVLRAQVDLSNSEADLIQSRNAVSMSKTRLLRVMGVSQDSEVELSDELVYRTASTDLEQAVATAWQQRPELMQSELQVRSLKENLRISESAWFPRVSGTYVNRWARPDPHDSRAIDWGHAWTAGVSMRMDLFTGFAREGQIAEDKARLRQARIALLDTQETVMLQLRQAILSIADAAEFVQSQKLNLERASEGLRLAEVGYTEGVKTQVEVLDARAALTRASSLHYQAIYSHVMAKLSLQRAMGILSARDFAGNDEQSYNMEGNEK